MTSILARDGPVPIRSSPPLPTRQGHVPKRKDGGGTIIQMRRFHLRVPLITLLPIRPPPDTTPLPIRQGHVTKSKDGGSEGDAAHDLGIRDTDCFDK